MQIGFIETSWNKNYVGKKRYYSKEHEDLSLTALVIFKDNFLMEVELKHFIKIVIYIKTKKK